VRKEEEDKMSKSKKRGWGGFRNKFQKFRNFEASFRLPLASS
jgi:hypothetical protein